MKEKYKYEISVHCSLNDEVVGVEVETERYGAEFYRWEQIAEVLKMAEEKHQDECGHSYDWDLSNGCHYKNCDGIEWDCKPTGHPFLSKSDRKDYKIHTLRKDR